LFYCALYEMGDKVLESKVVYITLHENVNWMLCHFVLKIVYDIINRYCEGLDLAK